MQSGRMAGDTRSMSSGLSPDSKIYALSLRLRAKLVDLLNANGCWQDLAGLIPDPDDPDSFLFSAHDISVLEGQWKNGMTPAQALLDHWSTSGRNQASIAQLLGLLEEADLLSIAHFVRTDILQIPDSNDRSNSPELELLPTPGRDALDLDCIREFPYTDLIRLTGNFSDLPLEEGGCKVGEGSYGTVYRARALGRWIAIKRLNNPVDAQFMTELKVLMKFRHENLLPLLGYSNDGPYSCIVYAYMPNGSLQERLACVDSTPPIPWKRRVHIAQGAATGINHLHTLEKQPMVHRDIKSANILLDENFVPKVGDFGLVRIGHSSTSTTMIVTQEIRGTCIYMAKEAFEGDITDKLDVFSFGVVLLELLTGLPPYDASREGEDKDLVSYMEDCEDILRVLDPRAGKWNIVAAVGVYNIARCCLKGRKKDRPDMNQVLLGIRNLLGENAEQAQK